MYSIVHLEEDQKRILFRNTAQKAGLHEAIIEKDFWVCLTLDYLFHRCKWKDAFTFKGGTQSFQMLRPDSEVLRRHRSDS